MGLFSKNGYTPNISKNSKIKRLYKNAGSIISQVFYYYCTIYLFFPLNKISVFFNYLVILLFGMYLCYRIIQKSYYYWENEDNNIE